MEVHQHAFVTSVLDGVSVFFKICCKECIYRMFEDKIFPLTNLNNSHKKTQRDALFLKFIFDKELYMFRTDLLSIIRSLNTEYTAIGICMLVMLAVC